MASIIAKLTGNKGMQTAVEVYDFYEKVGGDGGDPTEAKRILGEAKIALEQWLQMKKDKDS